MIEAEVGAIGLLTEHEVRGHELRNAVSLWQLKRQRN